MQLGEKHMHTYIYINLVIKDVPKNISSLCVKHRLTVLPNCPLFACFYSLGPTRLEMAFMMMWDPVPLDAHGHKGRESYFVLQGFVLHGNHSSGIFYCLEIMDFAS